MMEKIELDITLEEDFIQIFDDGNQIVIKMNKNHAKNIINTFHADIINKISKSTQIFDIDNDKVILDLIFKNDKISICGRMTEVGNSSFYLEEFYNHDFYIDSIYIETWNEIVTKLN